MSQSVNVEREYLKSLISSQVPVFVYLRNGIKLVGNLTGEDARTIFLKNVGVQMIYKKAVSTVSPQV